MKPKTLQTFLITGMATGVLLMFGPFIGAIVTVLRLQTVLDANGMSTKQGADYSMFPTTVGLVVCPIGLLILVICIFLWRKSTHSEPEQNKLSEV